jgi:uncharacterized protein
MKIRTRVRRVGITGSAGAGKTVFLLSLISHLEEGDLKLDGGGTTRFKKLPCRSGPLSGLLARLPVVGRLFTDERSEFDYKGLRKHLANRKSWPRKTTDVFFFRCRFQRSVNGRTLRNLWRPLESISEDEIEFVDFPGERVADVTMIGKSFAEWSDAMIRSINEDPEKTSAADSFIHAINLDIPTADAVLKGWKLTLGKLFERCHALITPSTYLVDDEGNIATERVTALRDLRRTGDSSNDSAIRERIKSLRECNKGSLRDGPESAQEFADACCAGLRDQEFAPLPEAVRKSAPQLAQQFEAHYKSYQKRVVRPFAANLLECHALIFLVDLTDVLGSGVQRLNDTQEMIGKLLECIEHSRGFFRSLLRGAVNSGRSLFGGRWGFIDRIAFVASKADRVHAKDRHKLKPLLDDLAGKLARNSGPSGVDCFPCSAVISTKPLDGEERKLVGRPMWVIENGRQVYRHPEEPEREVSVPALPDNWPHDSWKTEAYQFADFHPSIPSAFRQAPPQSGLDEVMKFVLEA